MTFCSLQNKFIARYKLTNAHIAKNVQSCFFIFGIQVILVGIVGNDIFYDSKVLVPPNMTQLVARFICAILLHI